jgi:CDP-glucose 4,6-dehydratase
MFNNIYKGKRVWLSGHTGFKGAWLAEWLLSLGAEVRGYALPPDSTQMLFGELNLSKRLDSQFADIRDIAAVQKSITEFRPDFVFHLAAQPLVRLSYEIPSETIATNVLGTVHVLDALRNLNKPCVAVIVTSDKCYENLETGHPHQEDDRMGGSDPYSASKGMAELAVTTYRRSFFGDKSLIKVASARAGNVIGGGDMAANRIVPDIIRAYFTKKPVGVRNPASTRPWQHVLEPLSGYLWLGACLSNTQLIAQPNHFATDFNFGPNPEAVRTVDDLVKQFKLKWSDLDVIRGSSGPAEAKKLSLSIEKAAKILKWQPVWNFEKTISKTANWYSNQTDGHDVSQLCKDDISEYYENAHQLGCLWTH